MAVEHPPLDIDRILTTLERHQVDFLLVGDVAAIAHGALRPTGDLDCLARWSEENLERLAMAMRELNARLRVKGLTDAEAAALPTRLDAEALGRLEISTWRTDAGDFDVLTDIPARDAIGCVTTSWSAALPSRTSRALPSTFAALEDVIASKERADRPKDRLALPELRALASRPDG